MRYNSETNRYIDDKGKEYIKSEFNTDNPVFILMTDEMWSTTYKGVVNYVNWSQLIKYPKLIEALKYVIESKLSRNNSPSYISSVHYMIGELLKACDSEKINLESDLSHFSANDLYKVWKKMNGHNQSTFREIYRKLAIEEIHGANSQVLVEMAKWKTNRDTSLLKKIRMWDADAGALSQIEHEKVMRFLEKEIQGEHLQHYSIRLFCRLLNETFKRPSQLLSMKKDALIIYPAKEESHSAEYLLMIPSAKKQTGSEPRLCPITEKLAKDIIAWSKFKEIKSRQEKHNLLFVIPPIATGELIWEKRGFIGAPHLRSMIADLFANKARIKSERTGKLIEMNPYRFRHTGATQMAHQGFSSQDIQAILEHDGSESSNAYITAVGSDLFPAINKATKRDVGKVFKILKEAYFFKGSLVQKVTNNPICLPVVEVTNEGIKAPAIVGSCNLKGDCHKHPFWACYGGCDNFLAWSEFDHTKSLDYVQQELDRWSEAEGGKKRSKLFKDFDKVAASIIEIERLKEELKHEIRDRS